MSDLLELAALKLYLGIEHTDDDTLLAAIIDEITAAVEMHCGRTFTLDTGDRTEYIDGGIKQLIIQKPPIASITNITDTFNDDEVVDSDEYDFDPEAGLIYISQDSSATLSTLAELGVWGSGRRRWKVDYKGGNYAAIPADVALAAKTWIADIYAHRDDLRGESLGDHRTDRVAGDMPDRVKGLLSKYTETVF